MTATQAEWQEYEEKLRRDGRLIETFAHWRWLIEGDEKQPYPRLVVDAEPKETSPLDLDRRAKP